MATPTIKANLSGLARRLVLDGILTEEAASNANQQATAEKKPFVAYLVEKKLADPRLVAVAAAAEFGAPIVDLDAMDLEQAPAGLVESAAEHEDNTALSPEQEAKLLKEQQAGAGDETTPAVGEENNAAEGTVPEGDEGKEG